MQYISHYDSPLGRLLLAADDIGLCGLWFEGQKFFASILTAESEEKETPAVMRAREWLDIYFSGEAPDFTPPLHLIGTEFQKRVWEELCNIPYGKTVTYGDIARKLGIRSAQAVGGAVGHNPISLIVPCHRVVGAGGSLTGYAGGIDKKEELLKRERS